MSKTIYIGGRLESKEKGNVVTGANAILDDTKGKKQNVINKETDDELLRLEQSKQDNLNFDNTPTEDSTNPVTSGGVYTAEKALSDAIEAILLLIPSAATALNKLVDTNTMNSSISTATATFCGTYNAVSDLGLTYQATHAQIEAALDALGMTADNNDFAFVQIPVSDQSQDIAKTERFKFNGTNWLYEYDLNTSGFTAVQWAAINSGITVALVTKLTDLPTAAALQLALNAKQDTLTFDNEPTALSQNPVTSGGIYTAIQAVATALSDYSTTTDGRLNVLEGLVPTEASSSNKLTDKAYVDGLIQAITELIPAEADTTNQLADKAYVLAQILAATPAFKGQFTTLAELQAVASPKAGDLGIVRTKDSDGMDVFTVYQYLNNAWNVFYSLSYHPQTKPATTGTTGDYPYNGMGRVELAKNMVNTGTELAPVMVNQLTQDMFYKGAAGSRVPNTNSIFVIRYDYVLAENITIPDGCVLEFEGGSISGEHTITGNNTGINAELVKIFNTNVTLAGTWNVKGWYIEWFGAKGDGVTFNRTSIQKAFNSLTDGSVIYIPKGMFIVDNDSPLTLSADNVTIIWNGTIKGTLKKDLMIVSGGRLHIISENGVLQGRGGTDAEGFCVDREDTSQLVALIRIQGDYSTVEGLKLIDPPAYGVRVEAHYCTVNKCTLEGGPVAYNPPGNSNPAGLTMAIDVKHDYKHTKIVSCQFKENSINGKAGCWIFVGGSNYVEITNNIFGKVHEHAIYNVCSDSIIKNNTFDGSTSGAGVIQHVGVNSIVSNNIIKNALSGAIGLFNCENTICDGNIITDSVGGGIGVSVYGNETGISFDNIQITNNTIQMVSSPSAGSDGVVFTPVGNTSKNLMIKNNTIYNAKGSNSLNGAIHVSGGAANMILTDAEISGNKIFNSIDATGIFLMYVDKSIISNNRIIDVDQYTIWARYTNDNLVSDNYAEDTRETPAMVKFYVDSNGARNHCKNNRCINHTSTAPFDVSSDSYLEGGNARSNDTLYGEFAFTGSSVRVNNANICKSGTINISKIILHPKDQAAAKIQASANCIYVASMNADDGYFDVETASGSAESTTGNFWYEIFQ